MKGAEIVISLISRLFCLVLLKLDSGPHFAYRRIVQQAVNKFEQLFVSSSTKFSKTFLEGSYTGGDTHTCDVTVPSIYSRRKKKVHEKCILNAVEYYKLQFKLHY